MSSETKDYPKIGVGLILRKGDKFLFGKRKNAHGAEKWGFPGGHLEFGETVEDCAKRELEEETGLKIARVSMAPYTEDYFEKEGKHYITLFAVADWLTGEPRICEPEKCEAWEWKSWDEPDISELFLPIQNLRKMGYSPIK